jgi:hypothetical protein
MVDREELNRQKHKTFIFYLQTLTYLFRTIISCLLSSPQCLEVDIAGLSTLDQPRVLLPRQGPS